jgi:lipopolysaccharide/colanic/teichoic acid biosynthesis glycosyltransferase
VLKRVLDLLIAVPGALVTAPVIAVFALLIRLESPGYPIYTQTRVGKDGREFQIYKLRTMVSGAEFVGAGLAIQEGDERITRVGTLLRRYSLDELPNLWNVLRGEMSIVGPRPTIPVQVSQYTERQFERLRVKPGITGWAQVNGRAALPWSERIELDIWYVEHQCLALDLRILTRTVRLLRSGQGLYKGETGGWHGSLEVPSRPGSEGAPLPPHGCAPVTPQEAAPRPAPEAPVDGVRRA